MVAPNLVENTLKVINLVMQAQLYTPELLCYLLIELISKEESNSHFQA